jgi:hypothetical protein
MKVSLDPQSTCGLFTQIHERVRRFKEWNV